LKLEPETRKRTGNQCSVLGGVAEPSVVGRQSITILQRSLLIERST